MAPAVPVQKRKGHRNGGREAHPRGVAGILRPRSCCLPVDPPYPFSILETPLLAKKGVTAHIIKRLGCLQALAQIFLFFYLITNLPFLAKVMKWTGDVSSSL